MGNLEGGDRDGQACGVGDAAGAEAEEGGSVMAHKVDTVKDGDRSVEIHWHAGGRIEIRLPQNEDMVIEAAFLPLGSGRRNRATIAVMPWGNERK
jgi:hypothetical protein